MGGAAIANDVLALLTSKAACRPNLLPVVSRFRFPKNPIQRETGNGL
jgi:hypothetical protein